jgi:hypothetical protein
MLALTIILITLVAHRELPGKFPALAALLVGVAAYYILHALHHHRPARERPQPSAAQLPAPWPAAGMGFDWWGRVAVAALLMMPVVLPFALATIVGGIDCTESAAAAGDDYDTRAVLVTEGAASLVAGLLGGVIQTTPYIGHPAYKAMGGRAAYTLATALFIGVLGYSGGSFTSSPGCRRRRCFPSSSSSAWKSPHRPSAPRRRTTTRRWPGSAAGVCVSRHHPLQLRWRRESPTSIPGPKCADAALPGERLHRHESAVGLGRWRVSSMAAMSARQRTCSSVPACPWSA